MNSNRAKEKVEVTGKLPFNSFGHRSSKSEYLVDRLSGFRLRVCAVAFCSLWS